MVVSNFGLRVPVLMFIFCTAEQVSGAVHGQRQRLPPQAQAYHRRGRQGQTLLS